MSDQINQPNWSRSYRVVQWATGNVGARAMQRVIEHPSMELVGVWVSNPAKVGQDAGTLAGIAPVGVKATDSIDDIISLKPDFRVHLSLFFLRAREKIKNQVKGHAP